MSRQGRTAVRSSEAAERKTIGRIIVAGSAFGAIPTVTGMCLDTVIARILRGIRWFSEKPEFSAKFI